MLLAGAAVAAPPIDAVKDTMGLRDATVVELDLQAGVGDPLAVSLSIDGQLERIELAPHSVRSDDYMVFEQRRDGTLRRVDPQPVRTLRGVVTGDHDSAVAGSLLNDGLHLMIITGAGDQYWLEPLAAHMDAGPADHVLYHSDDVLPHDGKCGMNDAVLADRLGDGRENVDGIAGGGGDCIAELACDADFEFFQIFGSIAATENRINTIINTVNTQYENQVDITHVITAIIVRSNPNDPYTQTGSFERLCEFITEWTNNQGGIQRDVAHLFTGVDLNGGVIGRAADIGQTGICVSQGGCQGGQFDTFGSYAISQTEFNGDFACATDLVAHELGHLWGAFHCNCPGNTMNPFITCANNFSGGSINSITAYRDTRTCLGGPCGGGEPEGACCIGGTCVILTQSACLGQGGQYLGDGTNCNGNPCGVPGDGILLCAQEVGPDVIVTLSGSLNLDATQGFFGTFNGYNGYLASLGAMGGPCSVDTYSLDVPNYVAYGPGGFGNWTSTTGDCVVMFTDPVFGVPAGYTDESPLSGTMTAAGQTFASLGWTPGVYVNTFTNGGETTTVTIQIGGECGDPGDPTGACCIDNDCVILTRVECDNAGGDYLGDGTNCDGDPCAPPDCKWDFNGDGEVGPPDLAKLLDNWGPCAPAGDCEPDTCPYEFNVCGQGCVCFTLFDGSGFCGPGGGCGDPCPDGNCPPGFDCIIDSCCGEGPICATNPPCDNPAAPQVFEPFQMTSIGQADGNGIVQHDGGIAGGAPVYIAATWSDTAVHSLDAGLNDLGSFSAGAVNPNGIATDGNLIYTGHFSTQEIVAYDFSGAEQFRYNADLSGLQAMEYIPDEDALAFYRGGEIRFIDRATGTFIRSFPAQPGNCEGMCLCDGVLWLLQSPNINGVSVADGTLITSVPSPAAGCAFGGSGLACSGADELTAGCNDGSWWKFSKTDGSIVAAGNNGLDMFGLKTVGEADPPPGDCPWDFNGDGEVGPPDLAKLLDNWGPCDDNQSVCDVGFVCEGPITNCEGGCVCFTLFDGSFFCSNAAACGQDCPNGDCPPGFVCLADTCCGPTTCVSEDTSCEPFAELVFEPFQMTTLGQADKNGRIHPQQ